MLLHAVVDRCGRGLKAGKGGEPLIRLAFKARDDDGTVVLVLLEV
jgi:hypothetical protein